MSLISVQVLAAEQNDPLGGSSPFQLINTPKIDLQNPMGDKDLPPWCPPANDPGLAVICGSVVTNNVVDLGNNTRVPMVPVKDVMVAAYEENPHSSTGNLAGALTNLFSSTVTNEIGRYRIAVRRVNAPNLKVTLVFFCGGSQVHKLFLDTWHNTWDLITQVDCDPSLNRVSVTTSGGAALAGTNTPPFPLKDRPTVNFLGCTNDRAKDTPIGLAKEYEPVINNIIQESNYDHRFTLNKVTLETTIPFFNKIGSFSSPGGLWEPDCLLRNMRGTYLCNAPYPICEDWKRPLTEFTGGVEGSHLQPCSLDTGCNMETHQLTHGYTPVKLYAKEDCTNAPDVAACEAGLDATPETIDAVMCDTGPTAEGPPSKWPEVMTAEDYLTRPFFKYIPKRPGEYEIPFRRFEYRNNLKDFKSDPYAPAQWINTFLGSTANTGDGGFPTNIHFRAFLGENSETPDVPSCNTLYKSNMPFQDPKAAVVNNSLVNGGFLTRLSEPYSTIEEIYYSGARDLSEYACTLGNGKLVRLCEIQVPWGSGALCNPYSGSCRDEEFTSRINQSLVRLASPTSLITDPVQQEKRKTNIKNTLANCNSTFVIDKMYFREDMFFETGNTQIGFHSDTLNDSLGGFCERSSKFEAAKSEQECEALTGSRIAVQGGGKAQLDSFGTVSCATDPKKCINDPSARMLDRVIMEPNFGTTPTKEEEQVKIRYLNPAIWQVDSIGTNQIAMCSISNAFTMDITGPLDEMAGMALYDPDPEVVDKAAEHGGFFDNLFTIGNEGHRKNWESGTATWYLSGRALMRDSLLKTGGGALFEYYDKDPRDNINIGTSKEPIDLIFGAMFGRDIWDSMLTLSGGDTTINDLVFHLPEIQNALTNSLKGRNFWKSFGHRNEALSGVTPEIKPYYKVVFDYPLTQLGFKDSFHLPGELPDGTKYVPELVPEEWGPGHPCYNFDTPVQPGQFCGTYREPPYGISRTCRLDRCVNFKRVETATCTCKKVAAIPGIPIIGNGVKCEIEDDSREVRNLIIEDCSWENKLTCALRQETTRAWESWPAGYTGAHYYADGREAEIRTDEFPPEDIDLIISNEDHGACVTIAGKEVCVGEDPSDYNPSHIEETNPNGTPVCYDKYSKRWENPKTKEYSYTVTGGPGDDRPRCWSTVAGPFRKDPNFGAVADGGIKEPVIDAMTGEQNNCNGYIKINDSALRAAQSTPFERSSYTDVLQPQQDLDKSTDIGTIVTRTFSQPYTMPHTGEQLSLVSSQETNEKTILFDGEPVADVLNQNQKVRAQGGVGDRGTLRSFFAPPVLIDVTTSGSALRTMKYHCDLKGTYVPHMDLQGKQAEVLEFLDTFNPDLHLDEDMGWVCPVIDAPEMPIVDLTTPNNSCTVRDWNKCSTFIRNIWMDQIRSAVNYGPAEKAEILRDMQAFEFPDYFKKIINFAGYHTKTPAAALLTVMYLEGGLSPHYYKEWGDNMWVYNKGANWWGQMNLGSNSTCNNLVWTAQGPYKILQMPVKLLLKNEIMSDRFCSILQLAGRPGGAACTGYVPSSYVLAASRCNFLDASVIAGFLMNPQAGTPAQSCSEFDIDAALSLYSETGYGSESAGKDIYAACGGNIN